MTRFPDSTILLVEDDPLQATLSTARLQKQGYKVIASHSGELALETVKTNPSIDLILMDIDLGYGMDGTDTAIKILDIRELPIVFYSSHSEPEIVDRVRKITRYGYILKNSGDFVLYSGIEMAIELFQSQIDLKKSLESLQEKNIHEKKQELQLVLDSIPLVSIFLDTNFRIVNWNQSAEKTFGYTKQEAVGDNIFDLIVPVTEKERLLDLQANLTSNKKWETVQNTNWNLTKSGHQILCEWFNTPVIDKNQKLLGLISIAQDITEKKRKEDSILTQLSQKEILLKEVHHRVKNNMATIGALLDIQANSIEDNVSKSHLLDAKSRVNGMMVLYDMLFRSSDYKTTSLKNYLSSLLSEMTSFRNQKTILIQSNIEDVILETGTLFPVGIIVNELVSNSLKHAFTSREKGLIQIQGKIQSDGNYSLIIKDDGIGWNQLPSKKKETGFGLELVEILSQQIKGNCKYLGSNGENGVVFELSFPF